MDHSKRIIEICKKYAKSNKNQRLADQIKIILKKGWFSNVEILETFGQVRLEGYIQKESPTQIDTQIMYTKSLQNPA